MTTTTTTTHGRDNRTLAIVGFVLFLIGLFIPFLCAAFTLPDALLYASCVASVLALIFGIMSWPLRLAKVAAIGAGLVCLLAIIQLVVFYVAGPSFDREFKSKMEHRQ